MCLCVNAQLITNGLIAYYNLNGNAGDSSGNNLHGTPTSPVATMGHNGIAGSAYLFNGSSDYILVPQNNLLAPANELSVSVWVKPLGFWAGRDQGNMIVANGNEAEAFWQFLYYDGDGLPFVLDTTTERVGFSIRFADGTAKGVECPNYIHTNNWYYLCFTYDGAIEKLYVNNVLVDTAHVSKVMGIPTSPMTIGRYIHPSQPTTWPYYVNGIIDELYIYNRALTEQEVNILYTEQVCSTPITVSITNLNSTYAADDSPIVLTGTPAGGIFYGTGIMGNTFYPNSAGVGTHTIVYAYQDSLGCSGAICESVTITPALNVNEINPSDKNLMVYPNPSNGNFRITFDNNKKKDILISVTNLLGQTVYTKKFKNTSVNFDQTIDLSGISDGLYNLTIDGGNYKMSQKIIKQK